MTARGRVDSDTRKSYSRLQLHEDADADDDRPIGVGGSNSAGGAAGPAGRVGSAERDAFELTNLEGAGGAAEKNSPLGSVDDVDFDAATGGVDPVMAGAGRVSMLMYKRGCLNVRWFLVFLMCFVVIQSMLVVGFTASSLTSLEVRYGLSSTQTGNLAAVYDVCVVLAVAFVGWRGTGGHKIRMLAIGLFVLAVAAFVFALPQVIEPSWTPSGSHLDADAQLSDPGARTCAAEEPVDDSDGGEGWAYALLVLGQMGIGLGAAPLYTLGPVVLDENLPTQRLNVWLGAFYACGAVGPAVAFLIAGYFLTIPVDPSYKGNLTPTDAAWVGAWWIGFIASSILALLFAYPLAQFPRFLPGTAAVREEKLKSTEHTSSHRIRRDGTLKNSMRAILSNKAYMCNAFGSAAETFVVTGLAVFMPKALQLQFNLTAGSASIAFGSVVIPGAAAGIYTGGWVLKRWNMGARATAKFTAAATASAWVLSFVFLIGCPTTPVVGIVEPYASFAGLNGSAPSPGLGLYVGCNADCYCDDGKYEPVCGSDGSTFFNGCFAGCGAVQGDVAAGTVSSYRDCACVSPNVTIGAATDGACDNHCNALPWFLVGLFAAMFTTFLQNVGATQVCLRSLHLEHRSLGMGTQSMIYRIFGGIPGPLVLGLLVDATCLHWETDDDGGASSNCWLYDEWKLRKTFAMFAFVGKACSSVLFWLSWYFYVVPVDDPETQRRHGSSHDAFDDADDVGALSVGGGDAVSLGGRDGDGDGDGDDVAAGVSRRNPEGVADVVANDGHLGGTPPRKGPAVS